MGKRLVVGLGNPGAEYHETRHNVGFAVIDRLAERCRMDVVSKKDHALSGWGRWRGREIGLAKPQTYMNRSGDAVVALLRRHRLEPRDMLVVFDDIHLPLGRVRMRPSGGAGGHNGIQDIIDWLDSDEFPRLRIGVGGEFARGGQSRFVLSPFEEDEREEAAESVEHACNAALAWLVDGLNTAMNRFNR